MPLRLFAEVVRELGEGAQVIGNGAAALRRIDQERIGLTARGSTHMELAEEGETRPCTPQSPLLSSHYRRWHREFKAVRYSLVHCGDPDI